MSNRANHGVLLEVCVGSLADAVAAADAGADRLELCGALELGGLTPSHGLIEQVIGGVGLPVVVMIRPRAGGFCYSDDEFCCMLRDAELALLAGAHGIVFGCLTSNGTIDGSRTKDLVGLAVERNTVFHRAFDFVPDKRAALEEFIDIGVTRVLTTGGPTTAIEGAPSLRQLNDQASGRIEILPAGGVTVANAVDLVRNTGCNQLHAGVAMSAFDSSIALDAAKSLCDLNRLSAGELRVVDEQVVAALADALRYSAS